MAPTKPSGMSTIVTRMRAAASNNKTVAENSLNNKNKRKAETTLTSDKQKRSAFGDLTNVSLIYWFPIVICLYFFFLHTKGNQ